MTMTIPIIIFWLDGFYETNLSLWLKWGYGRGKEQDRQRGAC